MAMHLKKIMEDTGLPADDGTEWWNSFYEVAKGFRKSDLDGSPIALETVKHMNDFLNKFRAVEQARTMRHIVALIIDRQSKTRYKCTQKELTDLMVDMVKLEI